MLRRYSLSLILLITVFASNTTLLPAGRALKKTCREASAKKSVKDEVKREEAADDTVTISVNGKDFHISQAGGPGYKILKQRFEKKGVRNNECAFHALWNSLLYSNDVSFVGNKSGSKRKRGRSKNPYYSVKEFMAFKKACAKVEGIPATMLEIRDVEKLITNISYKDYTFGENVCAITGDIIAAGATGVAFLKEGQRNAMLAYGRGEAVSIVINPRKSAGGSGHWVAVEVRSTGTHHNVFIFDSYPDPGISSHPCYTALLAQALGEGKNGEAAHEFAEEELTDEVGGYYGFHDRRRDEWVDELISFLEMVNTGDSRDDGGKVEEAVVSAASAAAAASHSMTDSATQTWKCSACTFENPDALTKCSMCNTDKEKEAFWTCATCTYAENKSDRTACSICDQTRDKEPPVAAATEPKGNGCCIM